MKLKIFYSWQSTTNQKYNRYFILECLKNAIKILINLPSFENINFELQEGVTNEAGSESPAQLIMDKRIPSCDIFIADLTIINSHLIDKKLPYEMVIQYKKLYPPFPNSNVALEYGIAYSNISSKQIIGILNSTFGSPKDESDVLPFDIRHFRFPIEYKLNEENKTEIKKIEKELTNDLVKAIELCALAAIENRDTKYKPFMVWKNWANEIQDNKFYTNQKIEELKKQIFDLIKNKNGNLRILGLSGLGKTRMLFEIFRPIQNQNESLLTTAKVLYLNYNNYENINLQSLFLKIIDDQEDRIIIIDNLPQIEHKKLLNLITRKDSKIILISVDSNPEEQTENGINKYNIKKEDLKSVVEEILNDNFKNIDYKSVEKIKEFSQGIPLMAELLAQSYRKGENFTGKIDDNFLLEKLLGTKAEDETTYKILMSCSLFNYFGFEKDIRTQMEFIASDRNITSLDIDKIVIINKFHEVCNHYLKREIFETRGRYIGLRPFPLAIYLTEKWFETCTSDKFLSIISNILKLKFKDKNDLTTAFCRQFENLKYNENAKSIVEKILTFESPFSDINVLNTNIASQILLSFTEVNPEAVAESLHYTFLETTTKELLNFKESRRYFVEIFDKLCHNKVTFNQSIKILYKFAVAENERLGNNATQLFLNLFRVSLSGKEINLNQKIKIIEFGLQQDDKKYNELAILAMKNGLGSEMNDFNKNIKIDKKEFYSSEFEHSYDEKNEYRQNILNKLSEIVKQNNEFSQLASNVIANSIFSFIKFKNFEQIFKVIKDISEFKNYDWDDAFEILKKIDKQTLSENQLIELNEIIEKLTKKDFLSRFKNLQNYDYIHFEMNFSDKEIETKLKELATEFYETNLDLDYYLPFFYSNLKTNDFCFGKFLFEAFVNDKIKHDLFIEKSIKTLKNIPKDKIKISIFGDFVSNLDLNTKLKIYNIFENDNDLVNLLFKLLASTKIEYFYLENLFNLIDNGKCKISDFKEFRYSNLSNFSLEEYTKFSEKLFTYGDLGFQMVFNIFYFFKKDKNDNDTKTIFDNIVKQSIYKLGTNVRTKFYIDYFMYFHKVTEIFETEKDFEFVKFINNSILNNLSRDDPFYQDNKIKDIYEILLTNYFDVVWNDISNILLADIVNYRKFFVLKTVLGAKIGEIHYKSGVLFNINIDILFDWCEKNKPLAPVRLSELVPIFANDNDDFKNWNPITLRLINEYGNNQKVLAGLNTNLGTFMWVGSTVEYYEYKLGLFEQLKNHKITEVSEWAIKNIKFTENEIKKEKQSEAEYF